MLALSPSPVLECAAWPIDVARMARVMHADRKIRQLIGERRSLYNQVADLTARIKSQSRL